MPPRFIFSKIAGISFMSDDFSERQRIAAQCAAGEYFVLQPHQSNPYTPFATRVLRTTNQQLGRVPEESAVVLCDEMSVGHKLLGPIAQGTVGVGHLYFGINFLVFIARAVVPVEPVTEYAPEVYARESRSRSCE